MKQKSLYVQIFFKCTKLKSEYILGDKSWDVWVALWRTDQGFSQASRQLKD